jgi:type VI secretion system secreted protein VgrG
VPSSENRVGFELEIGSLSPSDILLGQVVGFEGISAPFRFQLDLHPAGSGALDLQGLVGEKATLKFRTTGGEERAVHGAVRALELGNVHQGHPFYRAELVPHFALLQSTSDSRIFQNKSVPDIVKEVLDARRVKLRVALSGSYAKREFCLQYAESDLRFVCRLLEDEGISYFFEHGDDGEVLVLADGAGAYPEIPGDSTLPYRDPRAGVNEGAAEHVFAVADNRRRRSGKVTLRDFDFTRPDLDLTAVQESKEETGLELYEYPGGYTGPLAGKRLAKARLEAVRTGRRYLEGTSTCSRLGAGSTFRLADHPVDALNEKLLVVRVEHRGVQQHGLSSASDSEVGYSNRFVCVAADEPLRPERSTPRPRIRGVQTATVVGPSGEEIHPDLHGRIKVKFHWDRLGKKDEHASCFLRLAQRWAGGGFGQSVVPRIGQEVVVSFLEGDPDHPLVVGAVFNGSNAVPISLPDDRSQTVFRTDSSTGGGGSNEILLEDAKGSERFALHAQKDQRIEVQRDKRQRIGANESLQVGKDRTRHVGENQSLQVAGYDVSTVGKDQTVDVGGNRLASILGNDSASVGKVQSITISGASTKLVAEASAETVGAAAALTVGGVYAVTVGAVHNTAVGGSLSRQVAGRSVEIVAGSREETVGKDCEVKVQGDFEEQTEGSATFTTAKDVEETIDGKVELDVKEQVAIVGKSIKLDADTITIIVGGKIALQMKSGNVTFGASKAVIQASGNLTMKGGKIAKDASDSADSKSLDLKKLDDLRKSKASVKIGAKSADGAPLANLKFKAELPDGATVEGKTDGAGNASIPASKDGDVKLSFPDLDAGAWKTE